jgi:hypothetical protein
VAAAQQMATRRLDAMSTFVSWLVTAAAIVFCSVAEPGSSKYVQQLTLEFPRDRAIVSEMQSDQLSDLIRTARKKCSRLELGLSVGIAAAVDPELSDKDAKEKAEARAKNVKAVLLKLGVPAPSTLAWSSTLTELEQRRATGAHIDPSSDAVVVELICSVN